MSGPVTPVGRLVPVRAWSLRTKLVVALVVLVAVVCAVVGTATVVALRQLQLAQLDTQLVTSAERAPFAGDGSRSAPPGSQPQFQDRCPSSTADEEAAASGIGFLLAPGQQPGTLAARVSGGQVVAAASLEGFCAVTASSADTAALAGVVADGTPRTVDVGSLGTYRVVGVPADDGGDVLITGVPLSGLQATQRRLVEVELVVALLAMLLAGLAAAVVVRRSLRPLRRVAATAAQVSAMELDRGEVDLAVRVPERDTDTRTEVGQVGAALDTLLTRVGSALSARHESELRVRQFVADASHELRTPLASIRGYAELVNRDPAALPPSAAHAVGRVESEAKRMTGLVEDLLLLARLDAGRPLETELVDLTRLLLDAVSDASAVGRDHVWRLELPDEPVEVVGDSARLHQVLANLLANARTHTPPGTTVTAGLATTTPGQVVLSVLDDGPGIAPDLLPHVFDRFARGDGSRSRAAGSSGLGLAIVSAIVASTGGTVDVTSRPGQTAFLVRLPVAPLEAADPDPAEEP
ncbi:HAMP domain-containing protein [Streptomyces sp. NP160]|uniref:sensor histidine kinase n=1 Tax=Streptomyces sp. NP160 TaxID=2586637 RepID=UPI00111B5F2F|nr:HAMP domain-containing sensor histidine kinase [Streptomyces sp. NP160]TNM63148.1 HAMP domain-containing protein [Streptomyces sp. NP160]